jgi:hypothetical protein
VTETCATITGCNFKDADATTTANACTIQPRAVRETDIPKPAEEARLEREQGSSKAAKIKPRAIPYVAWGCEQDGPYGILWPSDSRDSDAQDEIRQMLEMRKRDSRRNYVEIRAHDLQITAFWWVERLSNEALNLFNSNQVPQIFLAYHPDNPVLPPHVPATVPLPEPIEQRDINDETVETEPIKKRDVNDKIRLSEPVEQRSFSNETAQSLSKRALREWVGDAWYRSMVSWPPDFYFDKEDGLHRPAQGEFYQIWDDSFGQGQTVYILERAIYDPDPDDPTPVGLPLLLLASALSGGHHCSRLGVPLVAFIYRESSFTPSMLIYLFTAS